MATSIKISQLPAKGANLEATDLLEVSEFNGTGYVSKSITGAEIIASVPPTTVDWGDIGGTLSAQTDLQTALNAKVTGNTAITGATKTKITYDSKGLVTSGTDATTADIADSTNKRYVTDANLTVIGNTSGVNTGDQTLSGLGGVPTTRTLTINGTTQDLSADRTFTISTGITIGSTAITSGTVGRVLFEGTGNVVQESANLFWDNTNGRLGIGGTPGAFNLDLVGTARISDNVLLTNGIIATSAATTRLQSSINYFAHNRISSSGLFGFLINYVGSTYSFWRVNDANADIEFGGFGILKMYTNNAERMRIFSDGNIGVNTTTNGGFKVDVNGTFRSINGGRYIQTGTGNEFFTVHDGTNALLRANSAAQMIILGRGENFKQSTLQTLITYNLSGIDFGNYSKPFLFALNVTNGNGLASSRVLTGIDITGNLISNYTEFYAHKITNSLTTSYLNAVTYAYSNNDFHNAFNTNSGSTIIGGLSVNTSAKLQVDSTTQGFLCPRMTTTQKNAIATPATGLMVYDTTLNLISVYNGTTWITL